MLEDPIVKDQFLIGSDTVFDFGHRIFSPSDIACYVYNPATGLETTLTSGTDFSVGLKPETTDYSNGARVTLLTEQPVTGKLTVVRSVVPQQGVALPNFGKIPSESLEAQLDRTIATVQQLHDTVQLAYKIPYGKSGTTTPEDEIKKMISSGGGGGGGGGSSYEFSNEFTVTSGGSVSVNKIDKSKITGLSSALDDKQDKLVSGSSYPIRVDVAAGLTDDAKSDIVSSAGSTDYDGPFRVYFTGENETYIEGGRVFAGGKVYEYMGGGCDVSAGETVFLVLSSAGSAKPVDSYTTNPPNTDDPHPELMITRLAKNEGGVIKQIQFGDITCVPWGATGGGRPINAAFTEVVSSITANGDGVAFGYAHLDNGQIAGESAWVKVGTSTYTFATVPQGGPSGGWAPDGAASRGTFNGGLYGCSIMVPVESGQVISKGGGVSDTHVYFLKLNS